MAGSSSIFFNRSNFKIPPTWQSVVVLCILCPHLPRGSVAVIFQTIPHWWSAVTYTYIALPRLSILHPARTTLEQVEWKITLLDSTSLVLVSGAGTGKAFKSTWHPADTLKSAQQVVDLAQDTAGHIQKASRAHVGHQRLRTVIRL